MDTIESHSLGQCCCESASRRHASELQSSPYRQYDEAARMDWKNDMTSADIGLGINFHRPATNKDLASLLTGIASYERAVGRAFLAQRSQSFASLPDSGSLESPTEADVAPSPSIPRSSSMASLYSSQLSSPQNGYVSPITSYCSDFMQGPTSLKRPDTTSKHSYTDLRTGYQDNFATSGSHGFDSSNPHISSPTQALGDDFNHFIDSFDINSLQDFSRGQLHAGFDQPEDFTSPRSESPLMLPSDLPNYAANNEHDHPHPHPTVSTSVDRQPTPSISEASGSTPTQSRPPMRHTKSSGWTEEADEQLRREVINSRQSTSSKSIQWSQIASRITGKTGVQCQARWAEALDQNIRKGRWSAQEDKALRMGFREVGTCWSKIAEVVQSRTQRQCRSRWLQLNSAFQASNSHV